MKRHQKEHDTTTITAFNEDTGNADITSNTAPAPTNNPVAVRTFSYGMLGDLRVIQDAKGEPWFVAADVCKYLGFDNNHTRMALQGLDEDEKATILKVVGRHDFNGLRKDALLVSEAGLYSLILRSRKPEARDFKRWVTHEVLPAIRRHGGYLTPDKLSEALLSPDTLIRLAHNLKAAQEKAAAEERLRLEVEEKLEEAQPKAETYDKVVAPSRLSVTQFARRLHGVNINAVKRSLMEVGYLYKPDYTTYRVYSRYRDVFFAEKYDNEYGFHHIIALPAGQQLMVRLYNEGRLIMRRGFDHAE